MRILTLILCLFLSSSTVLAADACYGPITGVSWVWRLARGIVGVVGWDIGTGVVRPVETSGAPGYYAHRQVWAGDFRPTASIPPTIAIDYEGNVVKVTGKAETINGSKSRVLVNRQINARIRNYEGMDEATSVVFFIKEFLDSAFASEGVGKLLQDDVKSTQAELQDRVFARMFVARYAQDINSLGKQVYKAIAKEGNQIRIRNIEELASYIGTLPGKSSEKKQLLETLKVKLQDVIKSGELLNDDRRFSYEFRAGNDMLLTITFSLLYQYSLQADGTAVPNRIAGHTYARNGRTPIPMFGKNDIHFETSQRPAAQYDPGLQPIVDGTYAIFYNLAAALKPLEVNAEKN